ncbi:MAG: glycine cleavage system protein GcvH [Gemmatales bacterium]|nr:glycine cleavage system protein GcvH [Gemmatales bacterium]MDW7993276.1 glycine cleavage system protein GcvH [Gemmatales bacterium]
MNPEQLRYTETHEWVYEENGLVTVGITQYAADLLNDLVYIELPSIGARTQAGASFGEVESIKAVSDLYAPVDGEVVEVNQAVVAEPQIISRDPYGAGWLIKIRPDPKGQWSRLLSYAEYQRQIAQPG